MKKLIILFILFTVSQSMVAFSSAIGRDHNTKARIWKLEDKSVVANGSFLRAVAGEIFIQQADAVVSFPVEILSWVDQKYVNQQLKEEETIKEKSDTSIFIWPRFSYSNQAAILITLSLILTLGLSLIWVSPKWYTIKTAKHTF